MIIMTIFRHGDVDGKQIKSIPKSAKLIDKKTVMYGEQSGHHHTFNGQVLVYEPAKGDTVLVGGEQIQVQKYVEVKQDALLVHQEHEAKTIPKGMYAILQEREYDPLDQQIRRVMD